MVGASEEWGATIPEGTGWRAPAGWDAGGIDGKGEPPQ